MHNGQWPPYKVFTSLMTALTAGEVERPLLAILLTKAILLSLERHVHENIREFDII